MALYGRERSAGDCGFPPRRKRDLLSTGILRIVDRQLTTFRDNLSRLAVNDVLGKSIDIGSYRRFGTISRLAVIDVLGTIYRNWQLRTFRDNLSRLAVIDVSGQSIEIGG